MDRLPWVGVLAVSVRSLKLNVCIDDSILERKGPNDNVEHQEVAQAVTVSISINICFIFFF